MDEHPDQRLARELWDAVSNADVEALERLSTDDVTWHASGRGPRSGTVRGRAAVLDYLASIGEDADTFDSELEDVLVGRRHTALLYRVTARRGHRRLETDFVLVMRMHNGRVAEVWSIPRDQLAVDEFWAA